MPCVAVQLYEVTAYPTILERRSFAITFLIAHLDETWTWTMDIRAGRPQSNFFFKFNPGGDGAVHRTPPDGGGGKFCPQLYLRF